MKSTLRTDFSEVKSVFGFRVRLGNPDLDFEHLSPDFPIERTLSVLIMAATVYERDNCIAEAWRNNVSTLLGPGKCIIHGLHSLTDYILPTMHYRSQHCWELLHPFRHHCQHGRNNSQHCWPNSVAGCYVILLLCTNLSITTESCEVLDL